MTDEHTKVEIGFGIGQVLSVKLSAEKLGELRKAVESGNGWFDLQVAEGSVALNLATVVFIRVSDPAHSIGFTS